MLCSGRLRRILLYYVRPEADYRHLFSRLCLLWDELKQGRKSLKTFDLSLVEHLIRARWPKHLMQKYKLWDLRFSFAKVVLENDETSWLKTFHNDYMVLPLLGKCGNQGTQIQKFCHNTRKMRLYAYDASKFDNSTLVILVPYSKISF